MKEIQEQMRKLNDVENIEVLHSFDSRTNILKIAVNTKEYKPRFGTEVYFGKFTQKQKEIYNTPEELLSILKKLKKLLIEESNKEKNESTNY
jgi:superfamily II helicase